MSIRVMLHKKIRYLINKMTKLDGDSLLSELRRGGGQT